MKLTEVKRTVGDIDESTAKQISLRETILALATRSGLSKAVRECSDHVAKRNNRAANGIFIPFEAYSRSVADLQKLSRSEAGIYARELKRLQRTESRALTTDIGSAGGFSVGVNVLRDSFIEILTNKMAVGKLGATELSGLQGHV